MFKFMSINKILFILILILFSFIYKNLGCKVNYCFKDNLILYYPFTNDIVNEKTIRDESNYFTNNHNFTLDLNINSGAKIKIKNQKKYLDITGSSAVIKSINKAGGKIKEAILNTGELTLEMWISPGQLPHGQGSNSKIFEMISGNGCDNNEIIIGQKQVGPTQKNFFFQMKNNNYNDSNTCDILETDNISGNSNIVIQILFVFDGYNKKYYMNGNLINEIYLGDTKRDIFNWIEDIDLYIGSGWKGEINSISLWNVALSENKISSLYKNGGNEFGECPSDIIPIIECISKTEENNKCIFYFGYDNKNFEANENTYIEYGENNKIFNNNGIINVFGQPKNFLTGRHKNVVAVRGDCNKEIKWKIYGVTKTSNFIEINEYKNNPYECGIKISNCSLENEEGDKIGYGYKQKNKMYYVIKNLNDINYEEKKIYPIKLNDGINPIQYYKYGNPYHSSCNSEIVNLFRSEMKDRATLMILKNYYTNETYLKIVFDVPNSGSGGKVKVKITNKNLNSNNNFPIILMDEPNNNTDKYYWDNINKIATFDFQWYSCCTDGFIFGPIDGCIGIEFFGIIQGITQGNVGAINDGDEYIDTEILPHFFKNIEICPYCEKSSCYEDPCNWYDKCGVCNGDNTTCPCEDCVIKNKTNCILEHVKCSIELIEENKFELIAEGSYINGISNVFANISCIDENIENEINNNWIIENENILIENCYINETKIKKFKQIISLDKLYKCFGYQNVEHHPVGMDDECDSYENLKGKIFIKSLPYYNSVCNFGINIKNFGISHNYFGVLNIDFDFKVINYTWTPNENLLIIAETCIARPNGKETWISNAFINQITQTGSPNFEIIDFTNCLLEHPLYPNKCCQIYTILSLGGENHEHFFGTKPITFNLSIPEINGLDGKQLYADLIIDIKKSKKNIIKIENNFDINNITMFTNHLLTTQTTTYAECERTYTLIELTPIDINSCNLFLLDIKKIMLCLPSIHFTGDLNNFGCNDIGIHKFFIYNKKKNWNGGSTWDTTFLPIQNKPQCTSSILVSFIARMFGKDINFQNIKLLVFWEWHFHLPITINNQLSFFKKIKKSKSKSKSKSNLNLNSISKLKLKSKNLNFKKSKKKFIKLINPQKTLWSSLHIKKKLMKNKILSNKEIKKKINKKIHNLSFQCKLFHIYNHNNNKCERLTGIYIIFHYIFYFYFYFIYPYLFYYILLFIFIIFVCSCYCMGYFHRNMKQINYMYITFLLFYIFFPLLTFITIIFFSGELFILFIIFFLVSIIIYYRILEFLIGSISVIRHEWYGREKYEKSINEERTKFENKYTNINTNTNVNIKKYNNNNNNNNNKKKNKILKTEKNKKVKNRNQKKEIINGIDDTNIYYYHDFDLHKEFP